MANSNDQQPTLNTTPPQPNSPIQNNEAANSVLELVHKVGRWSIGFGILVPVVYSIFGFLIFSISESKNSDTISTLIIYTLINLLQGGVNIWFGLKLKKVTAQTLDAANKTLTYLMIFMIVVSALGLISSGHSVGFINLILLIYISQAMRKIKTLKSKNII